jgi:hypothetical protein
MLITDQGTRACVFGAHYLGDYLWHTWVNKQVPAAAAGGRPFLDQTAGGRRRHLFVNSGVPLGICRADWSPLEQGPYHTGVITGV